MLFICEEDVPQRLALSVLYNSKGESMHILDCLKCMDSLEVNVIYSIEMSVYIDFW